MFPAAVLVFGEVSRAAGGGVPGRCPGSGAFSWDWVRARGRAEPQPLSGLLDVSALCFVVSAPFSALERLKLFFASLQGFSSSQKLWSLGNSFFAKRDLLLFFET